jgi:hypothetical protein
MSVDFRYFVPDDLACLAPQPEQADWLTATAADPETLFAAGPAWTALDGLSVLCCAGFGEVSPTHAIAWAIIAADIGACMVPVTRYARERIEAARYRRIEAIVRAGFAPGARWARMIGLTEVHTLRAWGEACEDHLLFERIV